MLLVLFQVDTVIFGLFVKAFTMFIHQVYFWLKNPDNQDEYHRLLQGIQSLRQIEPKVLMHIGVPAGTSREVIDASYSISELIVFETAEDQEAYQIHPVHQQFIADCSHLWERVVVYDSVNNIISSGSAAVEISDAVFPMG